MTATLPDQIVRSTCGVFLYFWIVTMLVGCDSTAPLGRTDGKNAPSAAKSTPGDVVLMKFGAHWCGPCRQMDQELDSLESTLASKGVGIERIDVDQNRVLAQRYGVSSIPHLVLLHDGQVVDQQVGYRTAKQLDRWVERFGYPAEIRPVSARAGEVRSNPYAQ